VIVMVCFANNSPTGFFLAIMNYKTKL